MTLKSTLRTTFDLVNWHKVSWILWFMRPRILQRRSWLVISLVALRTGTMTPSNPNIPTGSVLTLTMFRLRATKWPRQLGPGRNPRLKWTATAPVPGTFWARMLGDRNAVRVGVTGPGSALDPPATAWIALDDKSWRKYPTKFHGTMWPLCPATRRMRQYARPMTFEPMRGLPRPCPCGVPL